MAGAVKPKQRSAAAKMAVEQARGLDPLALSTGDSVEYGLTMEVKQGGRAYWPKVGVHSTVRAGETGEQAMDRIVTFATKTLDEIMEALK